MAAAPRLHSCNLGMSGASSPWGSTQRNVTWWVNSGSSMWAPAVRSSRSARSYSGYSTVTVSRTHTRMVPLGAASRASLAAWV